MELKYAYNCVSAAIYNLLKVNYNLQFSFEFMSMSPKFFELFVDEGRLSCGSPIQLCSEFLSQFNAKLYYPDMIDVYGAIDFARKYLERRGVLPVSINLKYDAVYPKTFDDDHWHFHLIVRTEDDGRYTLFNLFNGEYYTIGEAHLAKLIDTSFNYRYEKQFTPFMLLLLEDYKEAEAFLTSEDKQGEMLSKIWRSYPLEANLDEGRDYLNELAAFISSAVRNPHFVHQVLDFQQIITRSRELLLDSLQFTEGGEGDAFRKIVQAWDDFRNKLAMALMRRDADELARLHQIYENIVQFEYNTLRKAARTIRFDMNF